MLSSVGASICCFSSPSPVSRFSWPLLASTESSPTLWPSGHTKSASGWRLDRCAVRSKRHPDADFVCPLGHSVGDDSVDANSGQEKRDTGEGDEKQHIEAPTLESIRKQLPHHSYLGY